MQGSRGAGEQGCRGAGEMAILIRAPTPEWYAVLYSNCALFPVARWEFSHVAAKLKLRDVVVDFGCGSGAFLRSITGKVSKRYGYDFSDDAICSATASGIEAYWVEPLADLAVIANKGATQIVAFHVLEHLESPSSLFEFAGNVSLDDLCRFRQQFPPTGFPPAAPPVRW